MRTLQEKDREEILRDFITFTYCTVSNFDPPKSGTEISREETEGLAVRQLEREDVPEAGMLR